MSSRNILGAAGAVLVLNSAYLAAFATPSLFYYANVGLHVVLGLATLILAARWLLAGERRTPASWIAAARWSRPATRRGFAGCCCRTSPRRPPARRSSSRSPPRI